MAGRDDRLAVASDTLVGGSSILVVLSEAGFDERSVVDRLLLGDASVAVVLARDDLAKRVRSGEEMAAIVVRKGDLLVDVGFVGAVAIEVVGVAGDVQRYGGVSQVDRCGFEELTCGIIAIGGDAPQRVGPGEHFAEGVVGVGDHDLRIRHGREVAEVIVAIGGSAGRA